MDIDVRLRQLLEDLAEETECIKGSLIKDLKNPRYTSGKLFKDGDRVLMVLEYNYKDAEFSIVKTPENLLEGDLKNGVPAIRMVPVEKNDWLSTTSTNKTFPTPSLNMILLHENEIKEFCKSHLYVSSDLKTIRVVKKPENWIL